jgi:hypothetical protein
MDVDSKDFVVDDLGTTIVSPKIAAGNAEMSTGLSPACALNAGVIPEPAF